MEKNDDLRNRLFKVTSDFRKSRKKEPLSSSEHWQHESTEEHERNFLEKRKHSRQGASVYGIFETKNEQFRASTKNVSMGGVLIGPEIHLSYHELMDMTFFHRKFNAPLRTTGRVVRVDADGIGIQFDLVIPAMSSL